MLIEERHQSILEQLEKDKKVVAMDLSAKLNVSIDTIRRDLILLEENGFLKRTRGGAIPQSKVRMMKPKNFTARDIKEVYPTYDAIAKEASSYIHEGDTIYMGGTSIDYLMVKYLPRSFKYTVITNSIITADELRSFDNIEMYITCGRVTDHGNMRDSLAVEFVKGIRIDKAFMSGPTLSAKFGLSNTSFELVAFQRAVIESSKQTICLIPNVKLGGESIAKIADAKEIVMLITDWEAVEDEVTRIRDLGVDVIICKEDYKA
jgi:DeoR family transcriptional regulator, fructose operon transcriptional repressor